LHLAAALRIFRDSGDKGGEAEAMHESAAWCLGSGAPARARDEYRLRWSCRGRSSSRDGEAHALAGLGRCARASGETADALSLLRRSRQIFRHIEAPEAADVAAELSNLGRQYRGGAGHRAAREWPGCARSQLGLVRDGRPGFCRPGSGRHAEQTQSTCTSALRAPAGMTRPAAGLARA
jgi:hypothetical protein